MALKTQVMQEDLGFINPLKYGSSLNATTLNAALTAIGSSEKVLVITNGNWSLSANVTVPKTCGLYIPKGSKLTVANTFTLTINGPIYAEPYQIFDVSSGGVVSLVNAQCSEIYTEWFGAARDDSTNDAVAFNAAFAQTGKRVRLLKGTYRINSNLTAPLCESIIGEGLNNTQIRCGASVTKLFSLGGGGNYPTELHNFGINGNLTSNATGIFLGDAGAWTGVLDNILIQHFSTGANAVGLRIGDMLKSSLRNIICYQNYNNCIVNQSTAGFPTNSTIANSVFTGATQYGMYLITGHGLKFQECDFESSGAEGVYCVAAVGDVIDCKFDTCWFENNNGSDPTKYHMVIGDNVSARTMRVMVENCYFDTTTGGTKAKAIRCNGSGVAGMVIRTPRLVGSLANSISFENNAYGIIDDIPFNLVFSTIVSDANNKVINTQGEWRTYTPTYASDIGNAAATFSGGTVTTNKAAYKIIGKTMFLSLTFSGTLNAVTPLYIQVSLPTGVSGKDNNVHGSHTARDNAVYTGGTFRLDGGTNIRFYLQNLTSTYTSATNVGALFTGSFEIQ